MKYLTVPELQKIFNLHKENSIQAPWTTEHSFVKKSSIDGVGRFAQASIQKNNAVCVISGIVFKMTPELLNNLRAVAGENIGYYSYLIEEQFLIVNFNLSDNFGLRINHSCEPNVYPDGDIVWRAKKNIDVGDELTVDYSTIIDVDAVLIDKCTCGSSECRGKITGKDWLIPDYQQKTKDYFCFSIQRKIKKLN
jgi:uncharacterized protein